LPAIARVLPRGGRLVALVKPQFEIGREGARRTRGVVRDPSERSRLVTSAMDAIRQAGFDVLGDIPSSLPGPAGNIEHFVYARKTR
jgi:23S rRNA (cytidine1920-2'-O)/16S rRNA (cytidine1409-2'-O)-methyltransferase